ncbi:MAG TPA: carboxypeptidase-like regulatory domain-containing protein, partial [Candidatus Norongarragalinales archaeon]|nr:carboxypeptidase-like regulatory domain-containing protein [Candidatus Norongarragalinales archaeon]
MVFEGILDWADAHGLPFRSWAESLEEKGIPASLPLFLILLFLGAGAYWYLQQSQPVGSVSVYTKTADGAVIKNANVTLLFADGTSRSDVTDTDGYASFKSVPAGNVQVLATSPEFTFDPPQKDVDVVAGRESPTTFYTLFTDQEFVVLQVDVTGAPTADLTVKSAEGVEVDFAQSVSGQTFYLSPHQTYRVSGQSAGYLPAEKTVALSDVNDRIELHFLKVGGPTLANLHVRILKDSVEENSVENASVRLALAGRVFATKKTAEDGSIPPVSVNWNSNVTVDVSKTGYITQTQNVVVDSDDEKLVVYLKEGKDTADFAGGLLIQVRDASGNPVFSPIVRLFRGAALVEEK